MVIYFISSGYMGISGYILTGTIYIFGESLLVSRNLLDLVTEAADEELVFPPERWAATFRSHAQLTLHELGEFLGYSPSPLLERLIEGAQKIHPRDQSSKRSSLSLHNRGEALSLG